MQNPTPETPKRKKIRRLGPLSLEYTPGTNSWDFHLGALLLIVTFLVIGVHEVIYAELPAGEKEYPFFGLLSHFGSDMLALGLALSFMAVIFEHWRDQ